MKRDFFKKMVVSYISIISFVFTIYFIFYLIASNVVTKDIDKVNSYFLNNIQKTMDEELLKVEQLIADSITEDEMTSIVQGDNAKDPLKRHRLAEYIRKNLALYSRNVEDICLYLKKQDTVISAYEVNDAKTFFEYRHADGNYSFEEWSRLMESTVRKTIVTMPAKSSLGIEPKESIAIIQPLPINGSGNFSATMVILLKPERFMELFRLIEDSESMQFIILNDRNQKILSLGDCLSNDETFVYDSLSEKNAVPIKLEKGKKMFLSVVSSEVTVWKYIVIVPNEIYEDSLIVMKRLGIFGVVFFVALGFMIVFLLKRNYRPIDQLLKNDGFAENHKTEGIKNEFDFIREQFDSVSKERAKYENIMSKNLLKDWLLGNISFLSEEEFKEKLNDYDICFDFDAFMVVLCKVENATEYDENAGELPLETLMFATQNVFLELLNSEGQKGYSVLMNPDVMAFVVNFDNACIDKEGKLSEVIDYMVEFFQTHYNTKFTFAVSSDSAIGQKAVPASYKEALTALQYRFVAGKNQVIFFNKIKENKEIYKHDLMAEQKLINFIRNGNFRASVDIIDELFGKNVFSSNSSTAAIKAFISNLLGVLSSVIPTELLMEIDATNDVAEDLQAKLEKAVMKACEQNSADRSLVNNVVSYIHDNYRKVDLDVNSIGQFLGYAPSYASKKYREFSGESILDTIHRYRIEKAKEYLSRGESAETVASEVGYINGSAFIRVFKRYEGITPRQYKNQTF